MYSAFRHGRFLNAAAVTLGLTVSLAACGSQSSSSPAPAPGSSSTAIKIKVGVIPVADYVPVDYAVRKGYFKDAGLDVEVQTLQGGAAAVPGLLNGDLQVSITNWVSFVRATESGVDLRAFYTGGLVQPHYYGIYAAPGSAVKTPADLAGKTVAVTELKTISELTSVLALAQAGVDPTTVKFTQVPLPATIPAVSGGTVQAGWLVEPFATQAKAKGLTEVLDVDSKAISGLSSDGYITSARFARDHADALAKFTTALTRAVKELNADPAVLRTAVATFGKLEPAQVAAVQMPVLGGSLKAADVQAWADLMKERGFIDKPVDVSSKVIDASG